MPDYDLLVTAIRVLQCWTEYVEPQARDVQVLRDGLAGPERNLRADELACFVIERETVKLQGCTCSVRLAPRALKM